MPTFADILAGIPDERERAYTKARIFVDPASYGVDLVLSRTFTYRKWTLNVLDIGLGLEGRAIGLTLRLFTPDGTQVPLDNPFYIVNPFYEADGVENPAKAFIQMVTEALHDAAIKAGFEPPF